jgi:hypothetical protein
MARVSKGQKRPAQAAVEMVSFILPVDIEGGFPHNFKPIKATALNVPVRFELPTSEATVQHGKLLETTVRGAILLGEQIRIATRNVAMEESGG